MRHSHPPKRDHYECWEPETDLTVYANTLDDVVELLATFAMLGTYRVTRVTAGNREAWGTATVDGRGVTLTQEALGAPTMQRPSEGPRYVCRDPNTGFAFYGDSLAQALEILAEFAPPGLYGIAARDAGREEPRGFARVDGRGVTYLAATTRS